MPWRGCLDGPKGSVYRLFPIAQITRHLTLQESIAPAQPEVVQLLQTVLLLAQTMLRLLVASQGSQGKRQPQGRSRENPPRPPSAWRPFGVGKGALWGQVGFLMGVFPGSLLSKAREIFNGLLGMFSPGVVVRQTVIGVLEARGIELLQGPCCRGMQPPTAGCEEAVVG